MTKVPNTPENEKMCKCPGCPTWQNSDCPKEKMEKLYCARGKTTCKLADKGCICGACPVWDKYKLSNRYFCFNGVAE